jgi:hypothetical protein
LKNPEKYSFFSNSDYITKMNIVKKQNKKAYEYKLWYDGDINKILEYYKTHKDRQDTNTLYYTPSFMRLAPIGGSTNIGGAMQVNNFTVYHNPLPNIISRAMSNLLFSTEPNITFSARNKNRRDIYEERFYKIYDENNLATLLQKAAEFESYSGAIGFKLVLDPDFSDVPIIQLYSKEDMIINKKYDRVISIIFKDIIDTGKDKFLLLSEYGQGYIKYKLINETQQLEIPLNTIPETSDLNDLIFVDQNNEQLDMLLAIYKENKPGARSDYENSIDDFNAVDEAFSNMMNFIRKTAPKRVVSQSTLKQTENGDPIVPSVYDSDLVIRWDNTPESSKEVNELQQTTDINNSIQGYILTMAEIQKSIARTVGLSIKSIMAEDPSGANASADALSIRENIDMRTRDNKLIS